MSKVQERWKGLQLRAVVCPATVACAFKNSNYHLDGLVDNTGLWNATNFPSGTVPVTSVHPGEEEYIDEFGDLVTNMQRSDLKGSAGMPVGVQVVAWAFEDEVCLGVMKAIDNEVQFQK